MKKATLIWLLLGFNCSTLLAQSGKDLVRFREDLARQRVDIFVGGKPFTTYLFSDTLDKPILYPLRSPGGRFVTRGYPIKPRPGERTDHPHQVGLWFTYESVNGLDFWNNSYAIPSERKSHYGWIRSQGIPQTKGGQKGILKVAANWENQKGDILLKERTTFIFSGDPHDRIIDRITTLTAVIPVTFQDVKDGLIGIRVAHALEMPSTPGREKSAGNLHPVPGVPAERPDGNYLTSEGKSGDAAWGTRGRWCMLYGVQDREMESITLIDHPENPGYPTYWHARGYGLFAANPLGEAVFSHGKQALNLHLAPGDSVTFRYRVLITGGSPHPTAAFLDKMADAFAKTLE